MAWKVSPDPVDFEEALAWFLKRVLLTDEQRKELEEEARARAFWVAHVAQADLVAQVFAAIDKAIAKGTTLADFKAEIGPALRAAWSPEDVPDPAWRLETIFRTNVQNAYGAGRYRQATDPVVLEDRPVWMFDAILDGRETPICKACDGTKLDADAPWWRSHLPPLHFNCRSGFITLTADQAGKLTTKAPTIDADEGFGAVPNGEPWKPEDDRYPEPLREAFRKKTDAA